MNNWKYLSSLILCLALLAAGCASGPPLKEFRDFTGDITVSPDANPDHEGQPSPVLVRVYQLRSADGFLEADFFALYDDGPAVLGKDLITIVEKELRPGNRYKYEAKVDTEAMFVAVVAAFRNIEKARWRVVIEVPDERFFSFMEKKILQINVADLSVSAAFLK